MSDPGSNDPTIPAVDCSTCMCTRCVLWKSEIGAVLGKEFAGCIFVSAVSKCSSYFYHRVPTIKCIAINRWCNARVSMVFVSDVSNAFIWNINVYLLFVSLWPFHKRHVSDIL